MDIITLIILSFCFVFQVVDSYRTNKKLKGLEEQNKLLIEENIRLNNQVNADAK